MSIPTIIVAITIGFLWGSISKVLRYLIMASSGQMFAGTIPSIFYDKSYVNSIKLASLVTSICLVVSIILTILLDKSFFAGLGFFGIAVISNMFSAAFRLGGKALPWIAICLSVLSTAYLLIGLMS